MSKETSDARTRANRMHDEAEAELEEMRATALMLGRRLKEFGKARLGAAGAEIGADLQETSESLMDGARYAAHQFAGSVGSAERRIERSMRAHPANWAVGALGALSAGVLLGMALKRSE